MKKIKKLKKLIRMVSLSFIMGAAFSAAVPITSFATYFDSSMTDSLKELKPDSNTGTTEIELEDQDSEGTGSSNKKKLDDTEGIPSEVSALSKIDADPLAEIGQSDVDTGRIKSLGSSFISLARNFSILGMILSVGGAAVTLIVSGYREKNQTLSALMSKIVVYIVICGASAILNIVISISKAL